MSFSEVRVEMLWKEHKSKLKASVHSVCLDCYHKIGSMLVAFREVKFVSRDKSDKLVIQKTETSLLMEIRNTYKHTHTHIHTQSLSGY